VVALPDSLWQGLSEFAYTWAVFIFIFGTLALVSWLANRPRGAGRHRRVRR